MLSQRLPSHNRRAGAVWICGLAALLCPATALAYIGPGAGFALGGSFVFGLVGLAVAAGALFMWPLRLLRRRIRSRHRRGRARARRVVVLGLDGLDPVLARRWMREGLLPNLDRLRREGGFRPLGTSLPAMSPVAWSSFSTGVDASRHNIFDFLSRDPRTHLPVLSSTRVESGRPRRLGRWVIGRGKPRVEGLQRSKTFWRILAENGVGSTVLRVPITFPPEKFAGNLLSAMCVPDLRGTQGTFSLFSSEPPREGETTGGVRLTLRADGPGAWRGDLVGPDRPDGDGTMNLPVRVRVDGAARRAAFDVGGERFALGPDEDSPWIRVRFGRGRARARGICKFRVVGWEPFAFYVTPINIDPESPSLPISHPPHFAIAQAKLDGSYATLGLAEDTWALNERVIDERAFLDQTWSIHAERERQFFRALDRQREGLVAVVFDATDRIQHMFFRYLDPAHPANRDKDDSRHADAVRDLYARADDLVGRTRDRLRPGDVLLVVSDHGFKQFQRGVDLNAWFREHGYLRLKDDPADGPPPPLDGRRAEPAEIDWSRTRAYANGLAGAYLNLAGRESGGIVPPAEAGALKREIIAGLRGLRDPERGCRAISEVWDSAEAYAGPYRANAPDLIVGYRQGYRAGWDMAIGRVGGAPISDNVRSWSGDHCIDPRLVPGVLFASEPFARTRPALVDLAPSILELFGIPVPAHMTGRSIFEETRWNDRAAAGRPARAAADPVAGPTP